MTLFLILEKSTTKSPTKSNSRKCCSICFLLFQLKEKYCKVKFNLTFVSFFCKTLETSTAKATKDSTQQYKDLTQNSTANTKNTYNTKISLRARCKIYLIFDLATMLSESSYKLRMFTGHKKAANGVSRNYIIFHWNHLTFAEMTHADWLTSTFAGPLTFPYMTAGPLRKKTNNKQDILKRQDLKI